MLQLATTATIRPQRIETLQARVSLPTTPTSSINEELLPFTVKIVSTKAELAYAVQIRHDAYARHLPEFAETSRHYDLFDAEPERQEFHDGDHRGGMGDALVAQGHA